MEIYIVTGIKKIKSKYAKAVIKRERLEAITWKDAAKKFMDKWPKYELFSIQAKSLYPYPILFKVEG